jgi:hypothetical protein
MCVPCPLVSDHGDEPSMVPFLFFLLVQYFCGWFSCGRALSRLSLTRCLDLGTPTQVFIRQAGSGLICLLSLPSSVCVETRYFYRLKFEEEFTLLTLSLSKN